MKKYTNFFLFTLLIFVLSSLNYFTCIKADSINLDSIIIESFDLKEKYEI